ncbi:MAG: hypothetical protein EP319_10365 [Deltaproteobacteria bacterium]|nr:MAG: hypothetical protein EP319_10365 [Deltaproteobacteria bacterium]
MKILVLCILLLASLNLSAEDYDGLYDDGKWQKILSEDGLNVFTREMPNSKILGFKLEGVINAPIDQIMENMRNVETSAEWTPDLAEKSTIEEISDAEAITYSRNDLSWPISDRDFVTHNKLFLHKERKLLYVMTKSVIDQRSPPRKGIVRAWLSYSNIGLRPVSENRTYVEWTIFADPKGSIPTWVVNFYQRGFPVKFFKAVEKRAQSTNQKLRPGLKKMLDELRQLLREDKKVISKNK